MKSNIVRFEDGLAYRIYRCTRRLRSHFHQLTASRGLELSQEQWFVLNKLSHQDGLAQTQLGDAVLDDRPNITRLVASLEAAGLVKREPDAADGRKQCVFLTLAGRQVHDRFTEIVPEMRAQLLRGISKEDIATAIRVLARLEENM
jgi:MarR family transcriptional regulator, transcriptional regulator for hemolysin